MPGFDPGGAADALRDQLDRSLSGTYRIGQELGGGGMYRVLLAASLRSDSRFIALLHRIRRDWDAQERRL
jgi:hypothetical protein